MINAFLYKKGDGGGTAAEYIRDKRSKKEEKEQSVYIILKLYNLATFKVCMLRGKGDKQKFQKKGTSGQTI